MTNEAAPDDSAPAALSARASDVVAAAKLLRKSFGRRKTVPDALLSFDGSTLSFELAGAKHGINAAGEWPGDVRVASAVVLRLASLDSGAEQVHLRVHQGQLTIQVGSWSCCVPCTTENTERGSSALPLDATAVETLAFAFSHDAAEIERIGLKRVADAALDGAERKIAAAQESLANFGVTLEELRDFVRSVVLRRAR